MPKLKGKHTQPKFSRKGLNNSSKRWHLLQRLMNIKGRINSRNRFFDEAGFYIR